ncbi:MAG: threonylcarbamoyl-AMP synthase [bacterium]|nr:threonylcarbamoyl-AMP synthase [bacterium]
MDIITEEEFKLQKEQFLAEIEEGAVFIYPTDTIYGIGCNALNLNAAKKVREIKERHSLPFSVIAPSKKWIYDNCIVTGDAVKWVEKLPGPYTLIFELKDKELFPKEVNSGMGTIGVRIPSHWFSEMVAELGFPVVTTSANITGEEFMTSIDDLNDKIKNKVDFSVYEGEKKGRPSTIVKLIEEKIEVIKR